MVSRFLPRWRVAPGPIVVSVAAYIFRHSALFALAAQARAGWLEWLRIWRRGDDAAAEPGPADCAVMRPAGAQKAAMSVPQTRVQGSVVLAQGWFGFSGSSGETSRWRERSRPRWWQRPEDDDDRRWRDSDDETTRSAPAAKLRQYLSHAFACACATATIGRSATPRRRTISTATARSASRAAARPPSFITYRTSGAEIDDMEDLKRTTLQPSEDGLPVSHAIRAELQVQEPNRGRRRQRIATGCTPWKPPSQRRQGRRARSSTQLKATRRGRAAKEDRRNRRPAAADGVPLTTAVAEPTPS